MSVEPHELAAWDQYASSALIALVSVEASSAIREATHALPVLSRPSSPQALSGLAAEIADELLAQRRLRAGRSE